MSQNCLGGARFASDTWESKTVLDHQSGLWQFGIGTWAPHVTHRSGMGPNSHLGIYTHSKYNFFLQLVIWQSSLTLFDPMDSLPGSVAHRQGSYHFQDPDPVSAWQVSALPLSRTEQRVLRFGHQITHRSSEFFLTIAISHHAQLLFLLLLKTKIAASHYYKELHIPTGI